MSETLVGIFCIAYSDGLEYLLQDRYVNIPQTSRIVRHILGQKSPQELAVLLREDIEAAFLDSLDHLRDPSRPTVVHDIKEGVDPFRDFVV